MVLLKVLRFGSELMYKLNMKSWKNGWYPLWKEMIDAMKASISISKPLS